MFFKKNLFFIVLLCFQLAFSQSSVKNIDSLLKVVEKTKEDTIKLSSYIAIAEGYLFSVNDSSLLYAQKAYDLAVKLKHPENTLLALNIIGNYYENNVDYSTALSYYHRGLEIAEEHSITKGFAVLYNNIGMVYIRQGNYDEALGLMIDALKAEEELGNDFGIAQSYNNIGVIYYYQGNLKKATEYFEKALEKQEEIGDKETIKQAINNVGALYDYMKEYDKALEFYNKALEFNSSNNDKREMATNLHNIAVTYYKMTDYEKSEDYHQRSFALREEIRDYNGLALGYFNYGELLRKSDRAHLAEGYYIKALEIAQDNDIKLTEQYVYGSLAGLYEERKNFAKANEYLHKFITAKDTLLNREQSKIIAEVEAKYQTEKKEKELVEARANIAERELSIQRKDNLIYGTTALALVIAIIGYLLYNQQKLKNRQLQKENELKEALHRIAVQNQLQEQRLQISRDLHDNIGAQLTFIISSLDNIKYGFKVENDKLLDKLKNISTFTSNTIFELRDTIWAMNKPSISFEDFYARISNYIDKAREMAGSVKFDFNIDDEVCKNYQFTSVEGMNIYRIIQESVQNALKYAQAQKIEVRIEDSHDTLKISILDDGIGFDIKTTDFGNGLHNIKKRARDINSEIAIQSTPGKGTKIILEIPADESRLQKQAS